MSLAIKFYHCSFLFLEMTNATVDVIVQTSRDLLGKNLYILHFAIFTCVASQYLILCDITAATTTTTPPRFLKIG